MNFLITLEKLNNRFCSYINNYRKNEYQRYCELSANVYEKDKRAFLYLHAQRKAKINSASLNLTLYVSLILVALFQFSTLTILKSFANVEFLHNQAFTIILISLIVLVVVFLIAYLMKMSSLKDNTKIYEIEEYYLKEQEIIERDDNRKIKKGLKKQRNTISS